ncbi:MAG: CvpA family protein [Kiritimatiellia bacterium]
MDTVTSFLDWLRDPETPFGLFDLGYAVLLLYGFLRGIFRGLPEELSQLMGTVLIFFGSMYFYRPVSAFIIQHTRLEDPTASKALAYFLIFLVLMLAWKLLTFLIRKTLDWSCPKQIRRLGGALVGTAKNALLIAVVLAAVMISGHQVLKEAMIEQSWYGRQIQALLPAGISETETEPSPAKDTVSHGSGNA